MVTKTSTLGRIFLALIGFVDNTLHIIAYNTNPLYRAYYDLADVCTRISDWEMEMRFRELSNDLYYASGKYDADEYILFLLKEKRDRLIETIDNLQKGE